MQPTNRRCPICTFLPAVFLIWACLDFSPLKVHGAETPLVISLGNIRGAECGIPFLNAGLSLTLTNSALGRGAEGYCAFGLGASRLDLYPGNLRIDLGSLHGPLLRVEADALDACGRGCTRLILARGTQVIHVATNAQPGAVALQALVPSGTSVDTVYLSSFEGGFSEVRLIVDAPSQSPSLSFRRDGNQISLIWPSSFSGCVVQRSESLSPPSTWIPIPDAPVAGDGTFELRVNPVGRVAHFRLACP